MLVQLQLESIYQAHLLFLNFCKWLIKSTKGAPIIERFGMGRVLIGLVMLGNQCVIPWQLAHNGQDSWDTLSPSKNMLMI